VLIVSLKAAFEAAITGMNAGKPPEIESLRGGHVLRAAIRLKLPDGSSTPSIVVGIAPWDRLELILLAAPHQQTINTYLPVFSKFWRSLDYPPYRNSEALVGFTMPHATPGPLEGLYGDYLFMRSGHVIVNPDAASLVMGPDTFTNWEAMASANWDPTDNHTRQIDLGVYEVIGAKLRISYHSILAYLDERVLVCKQIGSDDCGKEKVVEGTFHTSPNRIQIGQTMIEKQEDQTGKTLSGKFATFAARDKASFTSDGKFTMREIGTVYAVPLSSGTLTPISGGTTNGQGAYEISRYTMILRFTDGHVETRRFEDLGTNPESGRTFRLGGRTYNERWAK
jgi:hypothetical protein